MSKHATLKLHHSEEAVTVTASTVLKPFDVAEHTNPISDYFSTATRLAGKLTQAPYENDAEVLGLLILGVVSAAEFYFRSAIGLSVEVCPLCRQHAEMLQVPFGTFKFFEGTALSCSISAFEGESLADSQKLKAKCGQITGFNISEDSSASAAIEGFELLCEVRHCLIHVRGVAGLKACRFLKGERRLQKVIIEKEQAFELLKLSHNAVRGFNRFLANSILNRWVDRDVLVGDWRQDKERFTKVVRAFWVKGEDDYQGIAWNAYRPFQRAVRAKRQAIAAKVAAV